MGGLSSWGVSVPSETFTKVMFSCLWWAPSPPLPQALGVGLLASPRHFWPRRGKGPLGDPPMGLGTAYSSGLSRRAQVAQRETRGPQPHRWPSGNVCEGCGGEWQVAGRELAGVSDRSNAKGRRGSEKSGTQSEGGRCGGPSMCIRDKTERRTGLSAGRPGYWHVK